MGKMGLVFLLFLGISARADLPAILQNRLQRDRSRDDLQSWIYDQLQWVAEQPGARSGQLVTAERSVWRQPRTDQECQAWLDLLVNEGYALLKAGNIVPSTDAYTSAFQWARDHATISDSTLVLNNILKPLGNNYTRLGDYDEADYILDRALKMAVSAHDRDAVAGTYSNLANAASNRGLPELSLDYCRRGLSASSDHSPYRGLLLSEQADALRQLGKAGEARESIRQAIDLLKAFRSRPEVQDWLFIAYQQAGDIDSAEPAKALPYYDKALDIVRSGAAGPRETAKLYFRLGELYRRLGRQREAFHWQDQCLTTLIPGKTFSNLGEQDLFAENTLADLLYSRALQSHSLVFFRFSFSVERLLRQQLITGSSKEGAVAESRARHETAIEAAKSSNDMKAMLEFMESSKAQLLLDEEQQRRKEFDDKSVRGGDSVLRRIRMLEKALVYYREQLVNGGGKDSINAVLTGRRIETERELAIIRKSRAASYERFADEQGSHEQTADQPGAVARHWQPEEGTEVRSFFCGEKALYELGLDRSGIVFAERLPLGAAWQDSVRRFLHRWFERGPDPMIDHPRSYFDQGFALYHDLFAAHPLQPGRHYIILPDGPLDLLPVEALPMTAVYSSSPDNWPLVVRQSDITYAWSIQTLGETSENSANSTGFTGLFISDNRRQRPALRAVTEEQRDIARSIHRGVWLVDTQATTKALQSALEKSAVVHVSAHASSGRDTGSVPRIELADSPFYMFHLMEMQHHPVLVVLSACRTGDGRVVTGEGVQSMARAFTGAGTNGVVTGWWNVHDEVAAKLIGRFYAQLNAGTVIPDALSAAKRGWLSDPSVPYLEKLPWYWAALNYQGTRTSLPVSFYDGVISRRFPWWWIIWPVPFFVSLVLVRVKPQKDRAPVPGVGAVPGASDATTR